ncbi:MAG: dCTP deaminase [Candidatus Micrarchaeota archaeon]|nr:dCTP deaminase [Candidatus Micrarchaeota archaeon]
MVYSDVDIKKLLKDGTIKIKPLEDGQIGGASVDLTLSDEWSFFKQEYIGKIVDLKKVDFHKATHTKHAKSIKLRPGEMCLAKTVEKITLPTDIMGKLEGRSRYARMGLSVHITSAVVQPGSNNHQVLEIVNFAPFTVVLHAGMKVSQVVFHSMESKSSKPYAKFGEIAKVQ